MPALKNTRYERFAQGMAMGKSIAEAYTFAGYKPSLSNGQRLKNDEAISARIRELQGQTAQIITETANKTELTRAKVLDWLQSDRLKALAAGQHAAAIRASELLGKELGMFVDKSQRDLNVIQHVGDKPIDEKQWLDDHKPAAAQPEPEQPVASPAIPEHDSNSTKH